MKLQNSFTENDIRPDALTLGAEKACNHDREYLVDRKDRWVHIACPACGQDDPKYFDQKLGFTYVECENCATIYTNPRPSQDLAGEFYKQSENYAYWNKYIFPASETVRRQRIFRPRAELIKSICQSYEVNTKCILEIGSAFGSFCEEIRNQDLFERIIAVEPTPDLAKQCREKGFDVLESTIEEIDGSSVHANVVVAFEVIEHIFCPLNFIEKCRDFLEPKGIMVLTCPNGRGFDVSTLRMKSSTFDHEHVNYFHPESIATLIRRAGLEPISVTTPGKMDAELVRKKALAAEFDLSSQPFLSEVLVQRWDEIGLAFQAFIADNGMSSHMCIIAQRPD